jgi:hypothetical protein
MRPSSRRSSISYTLSFVRISVENTETKVAPTKTHFKYA